MLVCGANQSRRRPQARQCRKNALVRFALVPYHVALMTTAANEARPENSVTGDDSIRTDLARLLQERLVHESGLGVFAHPILIGVIAALAWPDAPHDLLLGWVVAVSIAAVLRGAWLFIGTRRQYNDRTV